MVYLVHFSGTDYEKQDAEVEEILKMTRPEIADLCPARITPCSLHAFQVLVQQHPALLL